VRRAWSLLSFIPCLKPFSPLPFPTSLSVAAWQLVVLSLPLQPLSLPMFSSLESPGGAVGLQCFHAAASVLSLTFPFLHTPAPEADVGLYALLLLSVYFCVQT
jgi:hypothetical protein